MATHKQGVFHNSTEIVDGNEYEACEFRQCRLVYRGGTLPRMSQCHFADCQWILEDAADRTITFLRSIYHGGPGGKELVEVLFNNIRRKP